MVPLLGLPVHLVALVVFKTPYKAVLLKLAVPLLGLPALKLAMVVLQTPYKAVLLKLAVPLLGLPGPFVVMAVRQMPTPREATVLLTNNISLSLSLL